MRIVVQRVTRAKVTIGDRVVGEIGRGLLALVAFTPADRDEVVDWMADKLVSLRIFAGDDGRMNRSLEDVGGDLLVVSQFTLYGDARKGRRPSFAAAAHPDQAIPLYERFLAALRTRTSPVESGEFGAMMMVDLVNDGPVTLLLER